MADHQLSLRAQLLDCLTIGRVILSIILFFIGSFVLDYTWRPSYPSSIPMVGHGRGLVNTIRNIANYMFHYREWVIEGYEKHSKSDRAFIIPASLSRPHDIVLPRSQTAWLLERPDHIVSAHEAHNDVLYSDYNLLGRENARTTWYNRVIHKFLARNLPVLVPGLDQEVSHSVDVAFGAGTTPDDYKEVNLWNAWLGVVPQVTNRMLVGRDICRNEEFNKSMVAFVDAFVLNCLILNLIPKILHPVFGRLVTTPNWWHWRKATKHSVPVIEKRLRDFARKEAGDPAYDSWTPPEDFITWTIRLAKAENATAELDPYTISKRLLPIQFAAIHTTVLTGHGVLLDLLSSDPADGVLEGLREEAARVLAEDGEDGQDGQDGQGGGRRWTKNALARLYRLDSAIRESQRVSNFSATLVERKVVAPEGLTNPAEGWHVPQGAYLTFNLQGLHHDPELYDRPEEYDAFRFSRPREAYEALPAEKKDPEEGLRLKKLGMVTTGDAHLAFGHGRHACPGRFFVAHELKMVIAHLLLNYDLRHLTGERPRPKWVGGTIIPPTEATIQIKKRKAATAA
ncbi:cytochrome P450 [Sodiomyces alkalinus F11]|uniref:Cytochrome P450 n=1 Tax=Sodiomyces alkalinus (strain CBS 110278 / VKM F-3762 / F11) TaxID=1314773 RepID=A0A3N2PPT7_SODAK|nr:cytochrome P450 [Sodiomyces alkalinus F11]ROT36464.1 cytochrome P450 [Sodiomyces alkalinus F11]